MESVDQILYFVITVKSLKSKDNAFGDGIQKSNDNTTYNPPATATDVMQATCLYSKGWNDSTQHDHK